MKKKINIAALALIMVASASAQTIYDGAKFTQKDLNGTARFVGMGGAMGALGGDISTMGTNPAGIGIYRSNDIMGTFGFCFLFFVLFSIHTFTDKQIRLCCMV